jgi:hypothetical protein
MHLTEIDAFHEIWLADLRVKPTMNDSVRPDEISRPGAQSPVQKGTRNPEHFAQLPQLRSLAKAKTGLWVTLTQKGADIPSALSN